MKSEVLRVGRAPLSGVHAIISWRRLWLNFCHHSYILPLRKDIIDQPLSDRIICLLEQFALILDRIMCMFDQFVSAESDQHWFILRKTGQKMQKAIMFTFFKLWIGEMYVPHF